MRNVRSRSALVAVLLLLLSGRVSAEEATPSEAQAGAEEEVEEIVIVATPIIQGNQVTKYGSQLTTVTEDQVWNLNAQDLPSALRRTPGVIISRHNPIGSFGGGAGGTIFIRGHGSSRPGADIQILMDGIPRFVGVWAHPLMDVVSIDPLREIEVYKGPQPVLFGNMSFGAVNLLTKRQREEGFNSRLQGAYGSYHTWVEVAEHGGKIGAFDYYLTQSYRRSDGHREDADGELQEYFGRVGYAISDHWDLDVLVNRTDSWADDPGPAGHPEEAQGRFNVDSTMPIATLSHRHEWGQGYLKAYWDNGDIDWDDQFDSATGEHFDTLTDYDNYGLRMREVLSLWEGGEIMVGFDQDNFGGKVKEVWPSVVRSNDRVIFRLYAPYLAGSHQIGSKESGYVILSAGARFLSHSDFQDKWGPQAGLVLGYRDTQLHASVARGINYPGVNVVIQSDLFWGGNQLWKDLDPEILDHLEVGVSHVFGSTWRADLTFFYDDGRDRFIFVPPPPPPPHYETIESFKTKGVEATLAVNPLPNLSLFLGATYLDPDPSDLPYAPRWSGSGGANFRFLDSFQLSLDLQYVDEHFVTNPRFPGSRDKVDSFFLLNGKLSYEFHVRSWGLDAEIYLAGENLTDTDYEHRKDYPMPGPNWMVGFLLNL